MARKHVHEDHVNHEAWAIPYGDLVTLLLAFFVVMYAVSSVNEGKYRAVAAGISSAFGGTPRTITPIQLGQTQQRGSSFDRPSMQTAATPGSTADTPVSTVRVKQMLDMPSFGRSPTAQAAAAAGAATRQLDAQRVLRERDVQLNSIGDKIQQALGELMRQKLVTVRRGSSYLEIEIQSDILFASGVAEPSTIATATVRKLAAVLRATPNAMRIEGYTDDRPIRTAQFLSNWELSSARAASVVHVLVDEGVGAQRLAVVGYGEHQPIADNATAAGRNANRRVLLVILAAPQGPDSLPEGGAAMAVAPEGPDGASNATDQRATLSEAAASSSAAVSPPDPGARRRNPITRPPASQQPGNVAAQLAPEPGAG